MNLAELIDQLQTIQQAQHDSVSVYDGRAWELVSVDTDEDVAVLGFEDTRPPEGVAPADNPDSVKLDRHEREARAFAGFVEAQGHSLAEILGRRGPEDLVLTRDRFSPETLAELAMIAFPDDDEPDTGSVTSATVKTWTYSQVNPGGADVTHGFTFTGTDDEWAEHLAVLTHQGIEPYNAKITAPVTALGEPITRPVKQPKPTKIREGLISLWFEVRPDRHRTPETLAVAERWADDLMASTWDDEPSTDFPATPDGFAAAQAEADRMADEENKRIATANLPNWFYPLFAKCAVCGEELQFDIDPGGTPGQNGDWGADGDYGCITGDDEGSDGHTPVNITWRPGT